MLDSSDTLITGTYTMGYRYTQVNGTNHSAGSTRSDTNYWRYFGLQGNNGDTQNYIFDIFPEDDIYHNNHMYFVSTNTSSGNTYSYAGMSLAPASSTAWKGIKLSMSSGNTYQVQQSSGRMSYPSTTEIPYMSKGLGVLRQQSSITGYSFVNRDSYNINLGTFRTYGLKVD